MQQQDLPPVAGMGPGADMSEPPSIDELSAGQEYAKAGTILSSC